MKKMSKNDLNRRIGTQIYKKRVDLKMSQETLSETAGVSRTFISNLENGNYSARIDTYYRIACALDVTLGELFRGNADNGLMDDIVFLLCDCSADEIRAYTELLRIIKKQFMPVRK